MSQQLVQSSPDYVQKIRQLAQHTIVGHSYEFIADFFSAAANNRDNDTEDPVVDCFVWYYTVAHRIPGTLRCVLSPATLQRLDEECLTVAGGARLIILRGYPAPRWLAMLGYLFRVHPEYWRRHLDFRTFGKTYLPEESLLPSTMNRICKLRVSTVGTWNRFFGAYESMEDIRRRSLRDMANYCTRLADGRGWKQGDSIVRQYFLYDKEHFSIEQHLSIYLHKPNHSSWAIIVFLDCADDLSSSPHGPWLGRSSHNEISTTLLASDQISQETSDDFMWTNAETEPAPSILSPHSTAMPQSLSYAHLGYSSLVDEGSENQDPFHMLHHLLRKIVFADCQTLDLVGDKIKKHSQKANNVAGSLDRASSHAQQLYLQEYLEHLIDGLQEKVDLLRRQGGSAWSRTEGNTSQERMHYTAQLTEDFEHLLRRANGLLLKIQRSISLTMSLSNIEEARRGIDQNTTLFRFTIVASFYIPLSFTTSFFGMNFGEFGTGTLKLWQFFVVAVPVLIASVIALFIRRSWIDELQHRLVERFSFRTNQAS